MADSKKSWQLGPGVRRQVSSKVYVSVRVCV